MIYKRAHYKPVRRKSWLQQQQLRYGPGRFSIVGRSNRRRWTTDMCNKCHSLFVKFNDVQTTCTSCIRIAT